MPDQLEAYIEQQPTLLKAFNGKIIVMHDSQCQGGFDSYLDAVNFVRSHCYADGTYLIVPCTEGDGDYTGYFANIGLSNSQADTSF